MRVQRHLEIDVPVPSTLPPAAVVAALQTFSPVIRHLGTLARYEAAAPNSGTGAVSDDPFFDPLQQPPPPPPPSDNSGLGPGTSDRSIAAFQVYELITLAPGLTKEVNYPVYFQRVPNGLRCRADGAAGIVGWCEFVVRPRRALSPDAAAHPPLRVFADEYDLHEAMVIESNSLLMPFVLQTMRAAHRGLCDKILDEVMQQYYNSLDPLPRQQQP